MKKLTLLLLMAAMTINALADEGMWIPMLLGRNEADMQKAGMHISAKDIYDINNACLKDAIILFNQGCTGEYVSDEGLFLTNHHCGYSYITMHSTVDHDYLTNGFWAMDRSQEIPCPGLTATRLVRMEDVTTQVLQGIDPSTAESERAAIIESNIKKITLRATEGTHYKAIIKPFYYGNQYFMYINEVFTDVRLVGAPPSNIGKFGGDTDNWMWPRHTGDFSIFRIYADKNNEPADYSEDNIPYTPKRFFTVSRAGVREGDFTFVYGCPGSTKEYVISDEVRYVGEVSDPEKIALRTQRLDIQKKYMSQDQAVRIQYSSKNANVSNAWKKWQGEAKGLARLKTVAAKQDYERRFAAWAAGTRYEGLVERLHALYAQREPVYRAYEYYTETIRTVELLQFANSVVSALQGGRPVADVAESFYKDYYQPIDEEIFVAMLEAYDKQMNPGYKPAFFREKLAAYGSVEAWRDDLFAKSLFTDRARVLALKEADLEAVKADPAYALYDAFYQWYRQDIQPVVNRLDQQIRLAYRDYMQGQMEFEPDKAFYPDANLTLRVAYGHVAGYSPSDAIYYAPVSTLTGIMEKDNPDIFDYDIPQVLRDIYAAGGHDDQPVCFLATNHTSGGNSGSPVIDAGGNLIGINFDRVWEGTMSDLVFDPDYCRNISLDIRYLLFVVSEIGHADWLFDEMVFAD